MPRKRSVEDDGNFELLAGGTLGAVALAEAFAVGLMCPVCVVGAPILLNVGAYKKLSKNKNRKKL